MLHKVLAHANACVLDMKFIVGKAGGSAWFFCNFYADNAACAGVFDGITEQI